MNCTKDEQTDEISYRQKKNKQTDLTAQWSTARFLRHCVVLVNLGANRAQKLEGDLTWGGCRSSVLPPLLLYPRFTHSLPYSSFLLSLNLAKRSGEAL